MGTIGIVKILQNSVAPKSHVITNKVSSLKIHVLSSKKVLSVTLQIPGQNLAFKFTAI
jgi:hypothetical protein